MAADEQDVSAVSSPASEDGTTVSTDSASPGVTGVTDETIVGDRPLKNIKAELERKLDAGLGGLRQEIAGLAALWQARQTPVQPAQDSQPFTERQLAELAAAGQPDAIMQLTDRRAEAAATQRFQALTTQQATLAQLRTLYVKYPDLANPGTPLGALAVQHKQGLLLAGRPNSHETDLEAIKNAVIDGVANGSVRPPSAPVTEPMRQSVANGATSIDGATVRRQPAKPALPVVSLTDKEWEIAKRYGFKDKASAIKAKQNFITRQDSGASRLGAVGAMVRED